MDGRQPPGYPPQAGQGPFAPPQSQPPYPPLSPSPQSPGPPPWNGQAPPPASPYGDGLPPNFTYPWDPAAPPPPRRRRRRIALATMALIGILVLALVVRMIAFANAVSTEPLWSVHLSPIGEANVLVLGYGGQGHEGAYLTDSLLLLHSDLGSGETAQIGIPRDLWVQIPPDSGRYAKINGAYAYGRGEGGDPVAGGAMATHKVEQVTGLSTDQWVTIDFQGFRALVDALGGVDIEVERTFSSDYPANDDPSIDPSWTTVSFEAGKQHMDGETAIRYARARYANIPEEASDFARAKRQQRLVAAIGARLKQPTQWWRAFAVMGALQPALQTNLSPADLLILFLRADTGNSTRIRIDDSNVLENATSDDGQSILQPIGGDYERIVRYIREQLGE